MAASALTKTMMVLEEFRKLHPEMPMQIAVVLLHIARKPGISLRELTQLTGLGKSSVSRHVAALSGLDAKSTIQGDLVKFYEDPTDRRNKLAELTPAGRRFIATIEHLIDPDTKETT